MQHLACLIEHRGQVAEFGDLDTGHSQNGGQVVGRVGEGNRGVRALFFESFIEHNLGFDYQGVCATNGAGSNIF